LLVAVILQAVAVPRLEELEGSVWDCWRDISPDQFSLDGQHQDVDRTPHGRVSPNDRGREINGESTPMVWPTLGSRTAEEQNRTILLMIASE